MIEPYIEVPEDLWSVDYELIIEHGKTHDTPKYSRVCGNPILVYNDLLYVVNHDDKTATLTRRMIHYYDHTGSIEYVNLGK